ncbi:transcriptional regulator [Mycobacterium sp. 1245499.0]|uniref:winged helix-turn-helix domain-containing protein n=1 Tax=unclassified Mycobacterium TaxID=2642494 RepID=UPI00080000C2|nr:MULTISPECIES: response regulator transcription factor [unclassified Mycobacterium]OBJ26945.1 transcriptional regulator [Mycobacterium sp. 1245801.1]OBL01922.1 transcriptional regulator [Mycobacterium sp. 1245499.0]
MLLDVVVLTDEDDFESALPDLAAFAQPIRRIALTAETDGHLATADVAIIDARSNVALAQAVSHRLTTDSPATAVVALVAPADCAAVDVDCNFDDVMLPGTCAEELQARLRLAIGRRRSVIDGTLKFGDLVLHPASFTASLDGQDLCLTLTEFKLLNFLVQHAGQAFTRTRLMQEVWGYDSTGKVRTVDVHIRRLRTKLGARHQFLVDTVRGVGYRAATPPQPEWFVTDAGLHLNGTRAG